jgi:nucleoid-associated protein YgaU
VSQKKTYTLLSTLVLIVAMVTLNAVASSERLSLTRLPIRSLKSLLPPHGMKPDNPAPAITLLARPLQPQVRTVKRTIQITHRVQPGDTLSKISRQHYGSPQQWQKIYQANQQVLTNPNALRTGMILIIP